MAKRSRRQRKAQRSAQARAANQGPPRASLTGAAASSRLGESESRSHLAQGQAASGQAVAPFELPRGWKSWPLAVRIGLIAFLVFAVLVVLTKTLATFG